MFSRLRVPLIFLIIGGLVLTYFNTSTKHERPPTTLAMYYAQKLDWNSCYDNFQCTDFLVPIDYTDLTVGTFKISVLRYQAQDPKHRIGSLIVNPGGPGASGVDYAYNAEYIFDPDITDRYDIVGFDPRGVSRSQPIHCLSDSEVDKNLASDAKPDNDAEFKTSIKEAKSYLAKCLKNNKFLTSYSTANAARDMDILRQALGDQKLNYMGKSYGTYLGTLYASLFPNNIGRVILDGAIDPAISRVEQAKSQAIGFDQALGAFIDDCLTLPTCPLPTNRADAITKIQSLWQSAGKAPLPLKHHDGDKRTVTESLLMYGTASALYDSAEGWPELRRAFREAFEGYGDSFIDLADNYTGREKAGGYRNNEFDSGAIIDCLDFADKRTPEQIRSDAADIAKAAPVFGPYIAYSGLLCKYFATGTPVTIAKTKTNAPIVIIGTTGDPATPYAWAQGLAKLLPNSRLLTYIGDGHTGQGRGNACIDDAVDAFYLTGKLPAANLRCTQ